CLVVAGVEHHGRRIDAGPETYLLDLAHHLAIPLDELVGRYRGVDLHGRMIEQHLALEVDPARAFAGLAVGHAAQERPQLLGEAVGYPLAAAKSEAAHWTEA